MMLRLAMPICGCLLLCWSVFGPAARALGQEQIARFVSDIRVHQDGMLEVAEEITVRVTGERIRHGIYREFPTLYKKHLGIKIEVPFEVLEVRRDGEIEPYHTESRSNGVRVLIGSADRYVSPGVHTYKLVYRTDFQIGHFEDHDELYWNATGNGWEFPIFDAEAIVRLPEEIPADSLSLDYYTGPQGATFTNASATVDADAPIARFRTTEPLRANEGLTIVVGFPKGHIAPPGPRALARLYWPAIRVVIVALVGLMLVSAYYLYAWVQVGRDPPGGVIIPRFDPPEGIGPAGARFLRRMGYDRKCFAASLINLAVHKSVKIVEDDGVYSIEPLGQLEANLPKTDRALGEVIAGRKTTLVLEQKNHRTIKRAIEAVRNKLKGEYEERLFRRNMQWLIPGWILSAIAVAGAALSVGGVEVAVSGFMLLWGSFWTVACLFLLAAVWSQWQQVWHTRGGSLTQASNIVRAVLISAFATPFLVAEVGAFAFFAASVGLTVPLLLLMLGSLGYFFWHWIKQPTVEGQRLRDEIEGFRMYLGTAEREYLEALHPPQRTPELFERYLPYAIALDVENRWAEQFSDVLSRAAVGADGAPQYQPSWYVGSDGHSWTSGRFVSGMAGSVGAAIASSATAPGSSSGSSGGGFSGGGSSGGGGGGGGGGGW